MLRTDFRTAVQALHEERRGQLRVHPTLDDLRAYHGRSLPVSQWESIAEHLADCENCTILLLYGVIGPDHGSSDETLDAQLEEAWNRIRLRLENGKPSGRSLAGLLADGPLPVAETLRIALEASRALAGLHARGRVLNDLRAENLTIGPSGEVRVLDLGLAPTPASLEVGYGHPAEDALSDLYRSLSPEQVARTGLDHRSNLFSFGVLLYEMLTGESPFRDSTPLGTASRIVSLDPVPACELNPEVDPRLSALIDRLLAKEPEDRPSSAAPVVRELEALLSQSPDAPPIEDQIESLYDEIIALTRESSPRTDEIEQAYARLQELQLAEARQYRERFEASLNMPIDAGEQILARARALRKELEDLASSDSAAQDADEP